MTLGGAAQVRQPIARTNGLWTPQSAAITYPPRPQPAALWPSSRNVLRQLLAIFSNEYYQILIATHILIYCVIAVCTFKAGRNKQYCARVWLKFIRKFCKITEPFTELSELN